MFCFYLWDICIYLGKLGGSFVIGCEKFSFLIVMKMSWIGLCIYWLKLEIMYM